MDESAQSFLTRYPTTARWLDDIIDALLARCGSAHVKDIAGDLIKSNTARHKDTTEQIVTRRINDFCSDAADFDKSKAAAHDLFQRIEPATYRLRSYPERPDVMELVQIQFEDTAMQSMWDTFRAIARKKLPHQWKQSNNAKRLSAFVKWMASERNSAEYERRKAL